jgi:alkylhydroperoxidase family enzyme
VASHTAVAVAEGAQQEVVQAVLRDWRSAPVDGRISAALAYLEKLTLTPESVGAGDVLAARAAGVSDGALREATYVCFLFSVMDRLADVFGFDVPTPSEMRRASRILARFGYQRMSVPG